MDKPLTAKQFALILWGPVIIAALIWWIAGTVAADRAQSEARNAATEQSKIDTKRASEDLQRLMDASNAEAAAAQDRMR